MKSVLNLITVLLIAACGGGCTNMKEKEQAASDEQRKADFEETVKDFSPELKKELFERYFGKPNLEFQNRKIYKELTLEIIVTIPDGKLEQAVLDFTAAAIDEDWDNATLKIPELGPGFSAAYFVSIAEAEVANGGFNQFFFNSGRRAVELSRDGAKLMSLHALAEVISKALAIEEVEREKLAKVKEIGTIEALFESYDEISFDEADEAFVNLDIDFSKEFISFIRARPELFVGKVE